MQSHYEMAHPHTLPDFIDNDCYSSFSPISGPLRPYQNRHHLHHHHHLQFQQHPQQKQLYPPYEHLHLHPNAHQFLQYPPQFQTFQQEEQANDLQGDNGHCIADALSRYQKITNIRLPQEDSTDSVSFWETFNTEHSDRKQRCQQVNEDERCMVSENNNGTFGELEAVFILARNKETNQTGSASAVTGENSQTKAIVPLIMRDYHRSNVSATATAGVEHVSEASVGEEASMRRARKKIRKKKMGEELSAMAEFFQRLVKGVIDHQECLQSKFLEVIDRMDKERAEREEAWRRQENENYNREEIARAHERALSSTRESSIFSCMERITGESFNLSDGKIQNK